MTSTRLSMLRSIFFLDRSVSYVLSGRNGRHFHILPFPRPFGPLAFEWVLHSLSYSFPRQPLERGRFTLGGKASGCPKFHSVAL